MRVIEASVNSKTTDRFFITKAGHSYGGLAVRAFAALYRDEVAGLVLVDGSHPDQWVRFGVSSKMVGVGNKVSGLSARFGVFRIFSGEYKLLADGLPHSSLLS